MKKEEFDKVWLRERIEHRRLDEECAKLDPVEERQLAEEGVTGELETKPEHGHLHQGR